MYAFGTQFSMYLIAAVLGSIYGAFIFVPLFYPLKLTSSFEYFFLRFDSNLVRRLGTVMMMINMIFANGTSLFAPSSALEAVSGFPVWASIILCGISTTIYTAIGGMKAVIWTDVFQSVVILIGLIVIAVVGTVKTGGLSVVWQLNKEWDRIEFFDFDPDPTKRTTFWSIVVLMSVLWMCMTAAQQSVQRYCALTSVRKAQMSVLLNIPGFVLIGLLCCLCGTVAFAYYAKQGCDPMSAGYISNPNQILPYFVMDVIGYPGIPGLFVACLYSGAVSTISSTLNSMAAMTWEDLLKWKFYYLSEKAQTTINKVIVFVYGAISIGIAFVVRLLGGTFIQIVFSILGTTIGPIVGVFFLGGLFPRAGPWGALIGALLGWTLSGWMAIGGYSLGVHTKPLRMPTKNCTVRHGISLLSNFTEAMNDTGYEHQGPSMESELVGVQKMYAVSYLWYPAIGILTVLFAGVLTMCIPGMRMGRIVPRQLLFPCVRRCAGRCQGVPEDDMDDEDDMKIDPDSNENMIYKPKNKGVNTENASPAQEKLIIDGVESAL